MSTIRTMRIMLSTVVLLISFFAVTHSALAKPHSFDAGNGVRVWSNCGNADIPGVGHVGPYEACHTYGVQASCPYAPPPPPPQPCPVYNICIGNNLYQGTGTYQPSCGIAISKVCSFGCINNACVSTTCPDGSARPLSGICTNSGGVKCSDGSLPVNGVCPKSGGACVQGSSCVSAPNACGLVEGTMSCPSRICVPPSNTLCVPAKQCTGPDGVLINNGDTRVYYSDASCTSSQNRSCINGSLSGSGTISSCNIGNGSGGILPVISSFRVTPPIVNKGESCNIQWAAQNADNCTLTGTNISKSGWNASVPSGTLKTPPITNDGSYTLKCVNKYGSATKVAQCNLNPQQKEF